MIACSRLKFETAALTFAAPGTCCAFVTGDEGIGLCGVATVERSVDLGIWVSPDWDWVRVSWHTATASHRSITTNVTMALPSVLLLEDRPRIPWE